jgi:hypothetical protein
VNVAAAREQLRMARLRLELLQEQVIVEQALLKADKKNWKRRCQASRRRIKNSSVSSAADVVVVKTATTDATTTTPTDTNNNQHEQEQEETSLEPTLQECEDDAPTSVAVKDKVEEQLNMITKLQQQLEASHMQCASYEMQLLELERVRETNECKTCQERIAADAKEQQQQSSSQLKEADLQSEHVSTHELACLRDSNQQLNERVQQLEAQLQAAKTTTSDTCVLPLTLETTDSASEAPTTNDTDTNTTQLVMDREWHNADLAGMYTGTMVQKQPHGAGTLRVDDGAILDGTWHHGYLHGTGVLCTMDGDVYHGQWHHGKKHGAGTFCFSDGRVYQGSFADDQRHGADAIMTWPYGAWYRGAFARDKRNGAGEYHYADQRAYVGAYQDDRPHGRGVLRSKDGAVIYDGLWELGEFLGT